MSVYVKEELFLEEDLNLDLVKEEVIIKEDHDIDVVVKEEELENAYKGKQCSEGFPSQRELDSHYASHEGRECAVCSKTFKSKRAYYTHYLERHTDQAQFACEMCGGKWSSRSRLEEHKKSHGNCSECGSAYMNKRELVNHINTVHPGGPPFYCKVCLKTFPTLTLLEEHSVKHNRKKRGRKPRNYHVSNSRHKCAMCSKTFKTKATYYTHYLERHSDEVRFACEVCGKKLASQSRLKKHTDRHAKCSECECSFKAKEDLIKHISEMHPSGPPFPCKVCLGTFSTLALLEVHNGSHKEERRFKCDQCTMAYKWKNNLDHHKAMVHDNEGRFPCVVCGKIFLRRTHHEKHLKSHRKEKNHKCRKCGLEVNTIKALINHVSKLHPTENHFQCDACPKSFRTSLLLKWHSRKHTKKPHKCDRCDNAYRRKKLLDLHNAMGHDDKGDYPCELCGKKFLLPVELHIHLERHNSQENLKCIDCGYAAKSENDFSQHISTLHPKNNGEVTELKVVTLENEGILPCELCRKTFLSYGKLKKHMKRHYQERNHKCAGCGYAAKSKSDLSKHVSIVHPAETPFQCEACTKSFSTLRLLKIHSVTHNKAKPFKCDECSEAYKWKTTLDTHKALMHDNKAKFSCEVCGSRFLYQSRLNEHMDRHSKERNHKCSECDYAAKRKGDLIKHISKVHRTTRASFRCEVCLKSFSTSSLLKLHSAEHQQYNASRGRLVEEGHDIDVVVKEGEKNAHKCDQWYEKGDNQLYNTSQSENKGVDNLDLVNEGQVIDVVVKRGKENAHKCDQCSEKGDNQLYNTSQSEDKGVNNLNQVKEGLVFDVVVKGGKENAHKCDQCSEKGDKQLYNTSQSEDKGVDNLDVVKEGQVIDVVVKGGKENAHKCDQCSEKSDNQLYNTSQSEDKRVNNLVQVKEGQVIDVVVKGGEENAHKCDRCSEKGGIQLYNTSQSYDEGINNLDLVRKGQDTDVVVQEGKENAHRYNQYSEEFDTFPCEVCGKKFTLRAALKRHTRTHTKDKNHKCSECDRAYNNKWELVNHINKNHTTDTPFQCEVCSKSFSTLMHLRKHSKDHNEGRSFKCHECSETFDTQLLLKRHAVKHRGEKPYLCEKCGAQFKSLVTLRFHLTTHITGKNFNCDKCGKRFKSQHVLTMHKYVYHSASKPYQCEVCSKAFKVPSMLKYHSAMHKNERNFKCDLCDKSYKLRSQLLRHVTKYHNNAKQYKCNKCDSEFTTAGDLDAHKSTAHYVDKPFQCEQCSHRFRYSSCLRRHLFTHSDDRLFQCDLCPRTFKTDFCVRKHLRIVHKVTERDLSCESYSRKFRLKASLDEHVKDEHETEEVVETFEVKAEPAVIYDPEMNREISIVASGVKNEPEEVYF